MRPALRLVTPPTELAVTVEEARRHMRVEDFESDELILAYLQAAEQSLAYMGRAFKPATYAFDLYCWRRIIELPMPPLRSVTSITTEAGTVDPSVYRVTISSEGRGIVQFTGTFPTTIADWGNVAVSVEFEAGYDQVPAAIRAAILLTAESLFENRSEASPIPLTHMPVGVQALVANLSEPCV
jgi:uncharacterized phiE125 gp8 family phage protein